MKLPSYLAQSRHGIFYFRLTYIDNSTRKEKRWSLRTKNPANAKRMSLQLSAHLRNNHSTTEKTVCLASHDVNTWLRQQESLMSDNDMAKDSFPAGLITSIEISGGRKMTLHVDQSDPKDIAAAKQLTKAFLKEDSNNAVLPNVVINTATIDQNLHAENSSGTINEIIQRYESRNKTRMREKTLYEYGNMQRKFANWFGARKKLAQPPIHIVKRLDIADFIDHLVNGGVSLQTVQKKYLAALNGIFEFAQTMDAYPAGDIPTKNHKIYSRRDKKKAGGKSGWRPFSDEDLSLIFNSDNLLARKKPCDYWLPLLGIFTGGRISELCQLKPDDIKQIGGIWAIDINDEDDDQLVKTIAGIRKIPLHPQLIELGFLEYVEDVKQYAGTIFPYMTPDKFKHFGKTPGRRFGEFLDMLGIVDERKVFHSFRFTSNNRLKQNGVSEESRCQFIGHEYDTVNSTDYSEEYSLNYLLENVAVKLTYPLLDFSKLKYQREKMKASLATLMIVARKRQSKQN